jgi:hypothetical protein
MTNFSKEGPPGDEERKLIDGIDVSTIVGLGDHALIALLI